MQTLSSAPSCSLANRKITLALAALALGAAALGVSAPAQACSLAPCSTPVRLFEPDATVPGNLVYFKLLGGIKVDGELQPVVPFTLATEAGEPIPASVRTIGHDRVFAPDQPIAAGTRVVLGFWSSCPSAKALEGERKYSFTTSKAISDIAPRVASLAVETAGLNDDATEAVVKIRYDVGAAELSHLVDWQPNVEGVWLRGHALTTSVATLCARKDDTLIDSCTEHSFVPEGEHTLAAKGTIVGFDDLEEVSTNVETNCQSDMTLDEDSHPLTSATEYAKEESGGGGCSLSESSSQGGPYLLALLGLALARVRTSRRRAI